MLGKTLILGLISAVGAGSIVYYGTGTQGSEAEATHPHDRVKPEKSAKKERETIEPRLPTVRKADSDDGRKELASSGWKTDEMSSDEMPPAEKMPPTEAASPQPMAETGQSKTSKTQTRWLDQYLKKNAGEDAVDEVPALKVEMFEDADEPHGSSAEATNSYVVTEDAATEVDLDDIADADADAIADAEDMTEEAIEDAKNSVTDPRTFRIENGKLVEIDASGGEVDASKTAADVKPKGHSAHADEDAGKANVRKSGPYKYARDMHEMASDSTPLLSTVMREAAEIKKPELRDQAYFEITEYALSEGRYDSARMAHDMIAQEELAYTAKSRIAVAFAQNGQPTKAFKVIGEVDEPELRDFMRLQVIEALIAPERLPEAWQEKQN